MRLALKFGYNGNQFHGFAKQPNLKTVEGEIIKTLMENDYISDPQKSIFRFASRTDKKVSALGNVIAFNTEKSLDNIFSDINNQDDILFYGLKQVEPDFYPRYAKQRIYRYYLKKNGCDIDIILSAASLFTGEHNFSNFARIEEGKNPVRTIENIIIEDTKDYLIIEFYAQTYLWNQIRRIASAIEKVGMGKLNLLDISVTLEKPEVIVDYGIASAEPLILMDVIYDFNFEYNEYYLEKLKILKEKIVKKI
ncbi:MAG: tRNA pseudouridine(38-40) synthase TruA [Candidatus Thermoplasmatota archaeon]|nr:tRNA pseudouridine(38-40) synthase TruA [Candidatus Thermoplasmatota archaeon]